MIIEVALRLSGGDFSASLVPLAHGINYVKTVIEIAINKVPDITSLTPKYHNVVANRYFFLPQGRLEKIEGIDKIKQIMELKKLEFNYNIGDNIPRIENHGQRVGVFVVCGKTQEKVQQLVDIIYSTVIFKIDGTSYNGHPKYYK